MAQIKVITTGFTNGISELNNLNAQFKARVTAMAETETALNGMWEGEARTAFHNAFWTDKAQMDNFYEAIRTYAEILQQILTLYKQMESVNVETATVRTYR